ncbi:hypothetical protein MLD38_038565 [Melastoma candidum]|uniref:Uncharacterized protein n=1 Tax=Melastoma candidum TaxID=119954 RepID=A0ACB9L0C0_9MYRT|nr:hypothetical protein MLD38_038565 [Melastoma candidum]
MTLHSVLIQKLLSTNAHFGRRVATHHFKLYAHGLRNGAAIIDSDKTLICLRSAAGFIASLVRNNPNPRLMFVNTNPLFDEIVELMTKKIGCYSPSMNSIWRAGGFLTNSNSPKKFRSRNKKLVFGPTQPPDCLVVIDTERKSSVLVEAEKLQIPVVALVDSSMPLESFKRITYPIPANDSVQFVYLFCNMITKTILSEKKRTPVAAGSLDRLEADRRRKEEVRRIEKADNDFADIKVPVIPYEQLAPPPGDASKVKDLFDKIVVFKFNESLATDIGFNGPASVIELRDGKTGMDLLASQMKSINLKNGCNVPLFLLNSTAAQKVTDKELETYSQSNLEIHTFELNEIPQSRSSGSRSGGHDLVYATQSVVLSSLMNSATLDRLLSQGKEYALMVDSRNVLATIDPNILTHMVENNFECVMEVCPPAITDSKDSVTSIDEGKVRLGEITLLPSKSSENFKFIDTGNLWINLKAIKRLADVDAVRKELENVKSVADGTAAGSLIRFFNHATAISVPASHHLTLNTTEDLLLLQSDLYILSDGALARNPARHIASDPSIDLGPEFRKFGDFTSRFKSIPSIIDLESLKVSGDVWFGSDVKLKGNVSIVARPGTTIEVPDGTELENKLINDPSDL